MVDLTLRAHVKALIDEFVRTRPTVSMGWSPRAELADNIARHVEQVFINAPEALPVDDIPGDVPTQSVLRHALHYIERNTPADLKVDGEYRTVTDNLRAKLFLRS